MISSVFARGSTFRDDGLRLAAAFVLCALSSLSAQTGAPTESPNPSPASPSSAAAALLAETPNQGAPPRTGPSDSTISAPATYQLSPNDQVLIEVYGEDDLRTAGRLSADGAMSVPLLGSVKLGGLTLNQAATRLTELYGRDYLVHPKVNVTLVGYAKRRFTVLGQVSRPGSYEMPEGSPEGIDLLEAIAMAGGYTRIAAPERISVKRGNQVTRVDAKRLAKGRSGSNSSFRVEPGDTITVGESIF